MLYQQRNVDAGKYLHKSEELLRTLATEFAAIAQYPLELSSVAYNLGLLAQQERHPQEAVAFYKEAVRLLESLKKRFPATPTYRMRLAVAELALGETLAGTARAEAEASLEKALGEQSALLSEYPGVPEYQRMLGRSHYQLAQFLLHGHKAADALHHAEAALALHEQVLQTLPDSDSDQVYAVEDQILLTLALIDTGRLTDAQTAAEKVPEMCPTNLKAYLQSATLLIKCAHASANTTEGKSLVEDSLARAVKVLRDAVRDHVIRVRAILDLPDLKALHDRDDFQKLRKSLDESVRSG